MIPLYLALFFKMSHISGFRGSVCMKYAVRPCQLKIIGANAIEVLVYLLGVSGTVDASEE